MKRKVGTSTRVTLAVLAALLLLANAYPRQTSRGFSYGWPFEMGFEMTFNRLMDLREWKEVRPFFFVHPVSAIYNAAWVVALWAGAGVLAEWTARLVRRHKGMLRLHLSTLMVLVMVAAGLVGANVMGQRRTYYTTNAEYVDGVRSWVTFDGEFMVYGFPWIIELEDSITLASLKWAINLLFACAVLGLIGWRLEKRARKGQGASPGRERAEPDAGL